MEKTCLNLKLIENANMKNWLNIILRNWINVLKLNLKLFFDTILLHESYHNTVIAASLLTWR